MTVDVLLPTYNRASYAGHQVEALRQIRLRLQGRVDLRVVISDNHSTPAVLMREGWATFVRIVRPPEHFGTAEENIFFGLQHCIAEYVWLLGDDDPPLLDNACEILLGLVDTGPDLLVANAAGGMVDGTIHPSRTNCALAGQVSSLPELVRRTGFQFVLAGISCVMFRREKALARRSDFRAYFEISKIYSLAFWLADVFWEGPFVFRPKALVIYKQNKSDLGGDHWARVAAREGYFQNYPWTLGWARLCERLARSRGFDFSFYGSVIEQNWTHRYSAVAVSLYMFLNQLDAETGSGANKGTPAVRAMRPDERNEYLALMAQADPVCLEVYVALSAADVHMASVRALARAALDPFLKAFYARYLVKQVVGWNIYRFDQVYRALPRDFVHELQDELTDIAPVTSAYQVVGATLAEVEDLVRTRAYPKPDRALNASLGLEKGELEVLRK